MRNPMTLSVAILALAACGQKTPATEEGAAASAAAPAGETAGTDEASAPALAGEDGAGLRLYVLDCGHFEVSDLGVFDRAGAYDGQTGELVDTCYLIRHRSGDLLWDTGVPDALNAQPNGVSDPPFHVSLPKTLKGQLAELGLAPEDIELLSLSHSHFDHVGNAGEYAGATWLVESAERAFMFSDAARANAESFSAYSAFETAETVELDGDLDVFGDGSVRIISTPGHTPGHASLLVNLPNSGPILLTGDLYHMTESREHRRVPTFNTDADETLRSMDRFEALAASTGARVVIQHEPDDIAALPMSPDYLD